LCGEETRIDVRGLDPDALLHRWSELSEGNSTERAGWEDVQVLEPILVDFPSWLARFDLSTVGDAAAVAVVAQWMYPTVQQLLGVCTAAPRTGGKRWLGSACNLVERPKDLRRVRKRDRRDTISVSLRNGTSYEVQLQDSSPDGELVSAVVPGTAGFALRQNWIGVLARIPIALLREAWIPDDPICVRVTVGSEEVWRAACGKYRGETTWMSLNRTATRGAGCSEHPGWEGSDRIAGGMELVAYPAFVGMVRHDDAAESEFPYVALLDPEWVRAVRDATGVPLPETLAGRRKRSPQLGLHVEDASGLTRSLYIEDGRRGQPAKAVLRTVKRPRGQRGR